jgi:hypothetical protein
MEQALRLLYSFLRKTLLLPRIIPKPLGILGPLRLSITSSLQRAVLSSLSAEVQTDLGCVEKKTLLELQKPVLYEHLGLTRYIKYPRVGSWLST